MNFDYHISDVMEFQPEEQVDALGLIYAHFPKNVRNEANHRLLKFLKPGSIVIFEAFSKEQLGTTSGGPKNLEKLFSIEEIKKEFSSIEFEILEQQKN